MTIKILHILPGLNIGGVEKSTVRLAILQKKAGHEPIIISSGGILELQLKSNNINHIYAPLDTKNPLKIFYNKFLIKKIIKETKCNIVHVHSRAPAWSTYCALKGCKTPWISSFHGEYGHQNIIKKAYNHIMLKGNGVIAVSNYIKEHIKSTYWKYPKIKIIYPGIDLNYFSEKHFSEEQIQEKRKSWNAKKDDIVLLLPGRLTRIKGHYIAIKALLELQNPQFKLICIGDGKKHYANQIKEADKILGNQVQLFSSEDDLRLSYLASDIVLNTTTKAESFGLTVAEAQAMNKPAIVSNIGGPKEIVQDGISGRTFKVNDHEDLAQTILETLENQFSTNKEHIIKFDDYNCANKTIEFYKDIINNANNA